MDEKMKAMREKHRHRYDRDSMYRYYKNSVLYEDKKVCKCGKVKP